jgi:hypothetical protein
MPEYSKRLIFVANRFSRRPWIFALIFILGNLLAVTGCTVSLAQSGATDLPPPPTAETKHSSQIIVKFRHSALDPSKSEFMRELARDAGATLIYVRRLSRDAHVFRIAGMTGSEQLARVIEQLSKRPDVEYAEPDRVLRHQ